MKKGIGVKPDICRKLQFEAVKGIKRLQFLLFEYRFFMDSEKRSAVPLSCTWFPFPLSLMFYVVETHALALLRLYCYFVKLETRIVGLFAIKESHGSLLVASLGVAKKYRRLGIGTCILRYTEKIAKREGKMWLEVGVLRKNIPAQLFYTKYGFSFIQSEKTLYIMRKEVCVNP